MSGIINNFRDSAKQQEANRAVAEEYRREIVSRYGQLSDYKKEIIFEPIMTSKEYATLRRLNSREKHAYTFAQASGIHDKIRKNVSARVDEYYSVLEESFPIDNERASKKSLLVAQMEGNFSNEMLELFGDYREFMIGIRCPMSRKPIGLINASLYLAPRTHTGEPDLIEGKYAATLHSTYIALSPKARRLGLAEMLVRKRDEYALNHMAEVAPDITTAANKILIFSEQNIPHKLDPVSYATDSGYAIDQVHRLRVWRSIQQYGSLERILYPGLCMITPYQYVQPGLEINQPDVDTLSLNVAVRHYDTNKDETTSNLISIWPVSMNPLTSLLAETVLFHLKRFFTQAVSQSVYDADKNPTIQAELKKISHAAENNGVIKLRNDEDTESYLDKWEKRVKAMKQLFDKKLLPDNISMSEYYNNNKHALDDIIQHDEKSKFSRENLTERQHSLLRLAVK